MVCSFGGGLPNGCVVCDSGTMKQYNIHQISENSKLSHSTAPSPESLAGVYFRRIDGTNDHSDPSWIIK
jgi:hypothetical protein